MKQHSGNGATRKKGDWKVIEKGRLNRDRYMPERSVQYPNVMEVGSAAYRRRRDNFRGSYHKSIDATESDSTGTKRRRERTRRH